MSTSISDESEDFHFLYPKKSWGLPFFYHLLCLSLFCAFYYGNLPQPSNEIFWGAAISYFIIVSLWLWNWPARFFNKGEGIILHATGITVNGRFAEWNDIERIDHGPTFFYRKSIVLLKLKQEKNKFWSFTPLFTPRALFLYAYPFVCSNVLPAIKSIRPDILISPVVERMIKHPDKAASIKRWLVLPILVLYIAVLTAPFWGISHTLIHFLVVGLIIVTLSTILPSLCIPLPRTARDRFVECSLQSPYIVGFAVKIHLFSTAERYAIETLICTAIAACAISIMLVLMTKRISGIGQILIAMMLVATTAGVYQYRKSQMWPTTDISHYLTKEKLPILTWGQTGTYLTAYGSKDRIFVLRAPDLTEINLPEHKGYNNVVWLDKQMLIRLICAENEPMRLLAYIFSENRETEIPTACEFNINHRRAVSPDSRFLAWVDREDEGNVEKLKVWDLQTMSEGYPTYSLPADVQWCGSANWIDDKELVLYGKKREDKDEISKKASLHLLRINLENGKTTRFSSKHEHEQWYPTSDFRFAFGSSRKDLNRYSISLVNLETDTMVKIDGESFPIMSFASDKAFRVGKQHGQSMLMELNLTEGMEHPLHSIPEGIQLIDVSQNGEHALLAYNDFGSIPIYLVLHIPSGARHRLHLSGMAVPQSSGELSSTIRGASAFSPDNRHFILQTIGGTEGRTFLFRIPSDWPQ